MLSSDVNLLIQLGLLGLLTSGILYVKRFKVDLHGKLLLLTVLVNGISIVAVMIPSAIRILDGASLNSFTFIVGMHSIIGLIVELVGLYIAIDWFIKKYPSCIQFKPYMRIISPLWVFLTVFGLYLYVSLYL